MTAAAPLPIAKPCISFIPNINRTNDHIPANMPIKGIHPNRYEGVSPYIIAFIV